jgi:uncharacterized protein (DUF2235 family)
MIAGGRDKGKGMSEITTERKRDEDARHQFLLTGYTQSAGIRIYAFERTEDARRVGYTVEVDLALIPGYGIRIQDLPLLCRELLQQGDEPHEIGPLIFTEQRMRSHAARLATAREDAENKKKSRRAAAAEQAIDAAS